mmetsp:Transcript_6835/g.18925  ORF Transcript_6835/g.18925 Transcript_6835/m.18925 type:complete len:200 (-) Transcript_6835:805-1404(-)
MPSRAASMFLISASRVQRRSIAQLSSKPTGTSLSNRASESSDGHLRKKRVVSVFAKPSTSQDIVTLVESVKSSLASIHFDSELRRSWQRRWTSFLMSVAASMKSSRHLVASASAYCLYWLSWNGGLSLMDLYVSLFVCAGKNSSTTRAATVSTLQADTSDSSFNLVTVTALNSWRMSSTQVSTDSLRNVSKMRRTGLVK